MCKKSLCAILAGVVSFFLSVSAAPAAFAEGGPQVSAQAAIVIHADSGKVLYEKNADEQRSMASTTKIMTALIALETAAADDPVVTITDEMVRVEGSSMGLQPGDQLTLKSLAAGMLIVSGNDAANSAAIAISGSTEAFAENMNQRAQELGMEHTHFVTPSGRDDDAHYSTARDMATLAAAAMKNPDFAAIVGQKAMNISFITPDQTRRYTNHNKLLNLYEGCTGVKTGFTKKSGRCLISAAERDGIRLIAVTLNAPDDWNDHMALLNDGFSQLECYPVDDSGYTATLPVTGGLARSVQVRGSAGEVAVIPRGAAERVRRIVELPRFVYAPVMEQQAVGRVRYILDGEEIAETVLTAQGCAEQAPREKSLWERLVEAVRTFFQIE